MSAQEIRRCGPGGATPESEGSVPSSSNELLSEDRGRGKAVQIIVAKPDRTFELDYEALQEILLTEEVRDRKVVVLSVAGPFRRGKSLLLDFIIRYLEKQGEEGWMGLEEEPLTGFSWKCGCERDTSGILMWSKPYIVSLPTTGEQVAVLLLDTQGTHDNDTTAKEWATIYALSTLVSSLQVYNLSHQIQENELQDLHTFTEYGREAMEENSDHDEKPFQSLCFLVRDWQSPFQYKFGVDGGDEYLKTVLEMKEGQNEQLKSVREHIRNCFEDIFSFLLPYPGKKMTSSKDFDGRLADIDDDFRDSLSQLVPLLVSRDNLKVKNINGNPVTGSSLLDLFKVYMDVYQSGKLPDPKSVVLAMAEVNNLNAQNAALDHYMKEMEEFCGTDKLPVKPEELEAKNAELTRVCMEQFRSTRKMGGEEVSRQYEEKLEQQILESYECFVKRNKKKQTPYQSRRQIAYIVLGVSAIGALKATGPVGAAALAIVAACAYHYT